MVGPFVELTADGAIAYWNNSYWFVHVGIAVIYLVLPGKKPKKVEESNEKPKTN